MPDVMKTLLMNPPSFENFDGGASSRWPATREIESYWYPVWLSYPAGLIPGSRLLDASPHKVNWQQTIEIAKDYEFLVLYTSTVGFASDVKLIAYMLASAADYAATTKPEVWRRYLAMLIDGLRPARDTVTELPVPPLSSDDLVAAMGEHGRRIAPRR